MVRLPAVMGKPMTLILQFPRRWYSLSIIYSGGLNGTYWLHRPGNICAAKSGSGQKQIFQPPCLSRVEATTATVTMTLSLMPPWHIRKPHVSLLASSHWAGFQVMNKLSCDNLFFFLLSFYTLLFPLLCDNLLFKLHESLFLFLA